MGKIEINKDSARITFRQSALTSDCPNFIELLVMDYGMSLRERQTGHKK
jgi:hypothetical protein